MILIFYLPNSHHTAQYDVVVHLYMCMQYQCKYDFIFEYLRERGMLGAIGASESHKSWV